MRSGLAALWYLESRQFVNRVREASRQPGRALLYLLAIAYFVGIGMLRAHTKHAPARPIVPWPYGDAAMFAYVALLGIVAYGAASGYVQAFACAAEAHFLTNSKIPEPLVVTWLQLRRCAVSILRMLLMLAFYATIWGPGTILAITAAILAGTIVANAIAVPMLRLRAAVGKRTAQTLAAAVAAAGILPMVVLVTSAVDPSLVPAARVVSHAGAGIALTALLSGHGAALPAFYAFGAVLIAAAFAVGSDLYPELYAASLVAIAFRERQRRNPTAAFTVEHSYRRASKVRSSRSFNRVTGPWTIAWKEWIAFTRSASMQRMFWMGTVGCVIGGAILGHIAAASKDAEEMSYGLLLSAGMTLVIFIALGSAVGLANDLRKPLWWMGRDPLWTRLTAWIAGTSWRMGFCLAAGLAAWSIASHLTVIAAAGIPLALATVIYLRAAGLALYAIFPSSMDQRGPLAMLRALVTYALAAPPAVAGIVTGVLTHSLAAGIAAGIAVSLLETAGLIAFAAGRISGRGALFAAAEAA